MHIFLDTFDYLQLIFYPIYHGLGSSCNFLILAKLIMSGP